MTFGEVRPWHRTCALRQGLDVGWQPGADSSLYLLIPLVLKQWWGTGEPVAFGTGHKAQPVHAHAWHVPVVTYNLHAAEQGQAVHVDVLADERRNAQQDTGT